MAKGYTQRDGVDYEETFSPVISIIGMRILISIGLKLRKYDVSNAYLYSELDKEIFIEIPEGYECDSTNGKGLLLKKALYGLKQSGALWNKLLTSVLLKYGYKRNDYEPSIFYKNEYNIILGTRHDKDIIQFELALESNFKITKGPLDEILGIKINETNEYIRLSQAQYISEKASLFELNESKEVLTPIIKGFTGKGSDSFTGDKYLKIMKTTRPDIQYGFSYLSRFCQDPTVAHWNCVRRALSYLFHNKNLGLQYSKHEREPQEMVVEAFVDASYLGDDESLVSTTGLCMFPNGHLVHWKSKKQSVASTSSCEAEIHAAEKCVKEILWIKGIIKNLGIQVKEPIAIHEDNQLMIKLAEEESIREGSKHLGAKLSFIRAYISNGTIALKYVKSEDNISDIFTKSMDGMKFKNFREKLLQQAVMQENPCGFCFVEYYSREDALDCMKFWKERHDLELHHMEIYI